MTSSRATLCPLVTSEEEIHEYVLRTPSGWSMEMNSDPPIHPENATMPAAAACSGDPNGAPMSMPRCPGL
jgi:hypothetical protein